MTLMEMRLITVDTFTHCRFGGNPAAVVPDCGEIPEMYFPQIANEINLTQTAFVQPSGVDEFRVHFYTPRTTILFSGHACLAAFFVLASMGYIRPESGGEKTVRAKLDNGASLDLVIRYAEEEVEKIFLRVPPIACESLPEAEDIAEVAKHLRLPAEAIEHIECCGFFAKDLIVYLRDKAALDAMEPDYWGVEKLCTAREAGGLYAVYVDWSSERPYAYARYTAPGLGIYEEAATGSAAAAAGRRILEATGKDEVTIYQGQCMKRPGRIEVTRRGGEIYLGGVARLVMDGIMHL